MLTRAESPGLNHSGSVDPVTGKGNFVGTILMANLLPQMVANLRDDVLKEE